MQVTGRVRIKLDSDQLRTRPGAVMNMGGIARDFDVTDQGESYHREKSTVGMVRGTIVHASDTDLVKLRNWKGTAFFETDTNRLYTLANAAVASIGDLSNGEVEVTIMGDPMAE